jgi:hypothetical protein
METNHFAQLSWVVRIIFVAFCEDSLKITLLSGSRQFFGGTRTWNKAEPLQNAYVCVLPVVLRTVRCFPSTRNKCTVYCVLCYSMHTSCVMCLCSTVTDHRMMQYQVSSSSSEYCRYKSGIVLDVDIFYMDAGRSVLVLVIQHNHTTGRYYLVQLQRIIRSNVTGPRILKSVVGEISGFTL